MLEQIDTWPVPTAAAAIVSAGQIIDHHGDIDHEYKIASITKTLTAWATLIATEEGIVELDEPLGQPDCTVRHLLSHTGGYPFNGSTPISLPGRRRIYSNTGIEMVAELVAERASMPFDRYLHEAVFAPLGMDSTALTGPASWACHSTVSDLCRFTAEVLSPTLVQFDTAQVAWTVQFGSMPGIVPGIGRYPDCPWGVGFEIKGAKTRHWMGTTNSPSAFGHFGGAGTFLWMERGVEGDQPVEGGGLALVALTDRPFGEWSADALVQWPRLSDTVLASCATAAAQRDGDAG